MITRSNPDQKKKKDESDKSRVKQSTKKRRTWEQNYRLNKQASSTNKFWEKENGGKEVKKDRGKDLNEEKEVGRDRDTLTGRGRKGGLKAAWKALSTSSTNCNAWTLFGFWFKQTVKKKVMKFAIQYEI